MRIVFVAAHGSDHTRRWVGFFADRGHDVHVVTCGDTPSGAEAARGRYQVHDLGRPWPGKLGYLLRLRRARKLIRSLQPDVVHAHHATSYGLLGAVARCRPFVVTCHGSDVLRSPRNPLLRPLVTHTLHQADLITIPGDHMRPSVERLARKDASVVVFQYGIDVDDLAEIGGGFRTRDDGNVRVVTARTLTRLYHTDDVIRAVALLGARGYHVVYDLAGDGVERTALERLAETLDVSDRVLFHGLLEGGESVRLLSAADVYVSVAASDGVSIALLEAMALGLVPVVSDIPANRAWIRNGDNGVLVEIDGESIANGIEAALGLNREDVFRRNLELVRARADRMTNLTACETLISALVASAG